MTAPTVVIPAPRTPDPAERWHLVTAAQAGDRDAFADLYRLYQPIVFRVVYRRVQNVPLAEDLTQDVFVRALRSLGSVSWQGRDIGAWLVTVAKNLCADHFKSGRYRMESTIPEVFGTDPDTDRRGDPAEVSVHNDLSAALDVALAGVTGEQRQVLALRFGAGLSVAETAVAMGRQEGAVKALQFRAVRAVERELRRAGVTSW